MDSGMRRTRFVNAQTLSLGTTTNTTNTTIVLSDATSLPSEGDFNISIEEEIMLVTHRTANSLTVVRGTDGTSSADHSSGQDVQVIATKTGMDTFRSDIGLSCTVNPNRLTVNTANFSWSNQGTSSLVQNTWGGISMLTQNSSSHSLHIAYMPAPSEPWTLTGQIDIGPTAEGDTLGSHAGLILGDSGSTKWESLSVRALSSVNWWHWDDPTSYVSTVGTFKWGLSRPTWMRWVNDGTNIQAFVSIDGTNWLQLAVAQSKTAFLSVNGPDRIGFYYSNHQLDGEICNLNAWLLT